MLALLKCWGLALVLGLLLGCDKAPPTAAKDPDKELIPLKLSILNYTDDAVDEVYVNGSWAASMVAHAGGGSFAGGAEVPRKWDPNYKLTVRWTDEPLYLKDPDAHYERDIAAEPYQERGPGGMAFLWIAFFPGGVVKLYPTFVVPGHPDFPEGLLAPSWECEKEFPGDQKCFSPAYGKEETEQEKNKP